MDFIDHRSTANFIFSLSATDEKFRITNNGDVGVGTSSPSTKLEVNGVITTAGLTTTADINFGDNDKAVFGAGSDLQIYHDGSASYVQDTGTGALYLQGDGGVNIRNAAGTENKAVFASDGAVTLYHNNAVKFATTSTGIDVTGTVTADSFEVDDTDDIRLRFLNASTFKGGLQIATTAGDMIGTSAVDDLCIRGQSDILFATGGNTERMKIGSGGDISFYEDTGTTAKLFWDASAESLGINDTTPENKLTVVDTDGGSGIAVVKARTPTTNGRASYQIGNDADNWFMGIDGGNSDAFFIADAVGSSDKLVITQGGNVGIGTSSPATTLHVNSGANGEILRIQGADAQLRINNSTSNVMDINSSGSGDSLTLSTNDTERLRIDSSGFAGLGTAAPAAKLDIVDTSADVQMRVYKNDGTKNTRLTLTADDSGAKIHYRDADNAGALRFNNNLGEVMRITANTTRVGIGTTNPDGTLHISGTGTAPAKLIWERSDGGVGSKNWTAYIDNTHDLLFGKTNDSGTLTHDYLHIEDGGNIGIGNSSPPAKLSVFGTGAGNATVQIEGEGGADPYINFLANNAQHWSLGVDDSDADKFKLSEHSALGTNDYLVVDVTGQVGIGTSSPAAPLSIAGSSTGEYDALILRNSNSAASGQSTAIIFEASAGTSGDEASSVAKISGLRTGAGSKGDLLFHTTLAGVSSEAMRIDSSGNLLVGKTSTSSAIAGTTLWAGGYLNSTVDSDYVARFNRLTSDGEIVQLQKDNTTIGSIGVAGSRPYLANNVNFGIKLDDFGGGQLQPATTAGAVQDAACSLGGSSVRWKDLYLSGDVALTNSYVFGNTDGLNLRANSGKVISMQIAGSEKARLDSSGNLQVGHTNSDNSRVSVEAVSAGVAMHFRRNTATYTTSAIVGSITCDSVSTAYGTSSDQRLKDNIVDAPSASNDIDAIQVRSFDWKADGSHQKYGMVAQELQSIAPEAVTGDADSDDMMGVDYSKLVPMLVKEIQSLRARVAQLEGEN